MRCFCFFLSRWMPLFLLLLAFAPSPFSFPASAEFWSLRASLTRLCGFPCSGTGRLLARVVPWLGWVFFLLCFVGGKHIEDVGRRCCTSASRDLSLWPRGAGRCMSLGPPARGRRGHPAPSPPSVSHHPGELPCFPIGAMSAPLSGVTLLVGVGAFHHKARCGGRAPPFRGLVARSLCGSLPPWAAMRAAALPLRAFHHQRSLAPLKP